RRRERVLLQRIIAINQPDLAGVYVLFLQLRQGLGVKLGAMRTAERSVFDDRHRGVALAQDVVVRTHIHGQVLGGDGGRDVTAISALPLTPCQRAADHHDDGKNDPDPLVAYGHGSLGMSVASAYWQTIAPAGAHPLLCRSATARAMTGFPVRCNSGP